MELCTERNGTQRALFQALWQIWGQRGLCNSHCTPDLPGGLTSLRVSAGPSPLACVWGRTSKGKVAEAMAGSEEGDWGLGPESCPEPLSGDSPLISRKSSAMTTGPLSMGLPEPLKTRPEGGEGSWGMLRASPGSPSLLLTLHTTTASHRPLMSLSHQPSVTHRELATVTVSLGIFPPLPEIFTGEVLVQEITLMEGFRARKRRGPGMADPGRKLGGGGSVSA